MDNKQCQLSLVRPNFAKDLRKQIRPSASLSLSKVEGLRANGIWIKPFVVSSEPVEESNHERRFKKESCGLFSGNWYNLKESKLEKYIKGGNSR